MVGFNLLQAAESMGAVAELLRPTEQQQNVSTGNVFSSKAYPETNVVVKVESLDL
jgi:hypothetical protein